MTQHEQCLHGDVAQFWPEHSHWPLFPIAMSHHEHPQQWWCHWVLIPITWRNLIDEAHICAGIARVALPLPAAGRFSGGALWQPAWAPAHPHHHHPLTQRCTGPFNSLSIYWSQQCLRLQPPLPHTELEITASLCQWPLQKHWSDPPDRLGGSAWPGDPGWGRAGTGGEDWLQGAGETLSPGCPWDVAKRSVLQSRHSVCGDTSIRAAWPLIILLGL